MRDQILSLLSQGLKQVEVTQIVGCDPSYISQLAKDKDFVADLMEARAKVQNSRIETKLAALEESTVKAMENQIGLAELPVLCKVLQTINDVRRSKVVAAIPGQNQNATIKVSVSVGMIPTPNIVRNSQNEVVVIDGNNLTAMPSAKVAELFQSMRSPIPVEEILDVSQVPADL